VVAITQAYISVSDGTLILKRERERVWKVRTVEVKRNHLGRGSEKRYISEGGRKSILLEGTQAMAARPFDKDKMGVKTL
jgi:hypothetical protein